MSNDTSGPARFTQQASTAEDLLKSQTVGLVQLSDFRKRRAEVLEQKEREAQEIFLEKPKAANNRTSLTRVDAASKRKKLKKRNDDCQQVKDGRHGKKAAVKGKLSFAYDDEVQDEDQYDSKESAKNASTTPEPYSVSRQNSTEGKESSPQPSSAEPIANSNNSNNSQQDRSAKYPASGTTTTLITKLKRLGPNPKSNLPFAPKALTKSAIHRDSLLRDALRKQFLAMQAIVRATEIAIPFVFYDGINLPGGVCRVKKGDHVWMFLDRARKVGARTGVGMGSGKGRGGGTGNIGGTGAGQDSASTIRSKKQWARVGVDDLLLVRGGIIIPHHYEFYHFILNKIVGFHGRLFSYSSEPTAASPSNNADESEDSNDDEECEDEEATEVRLSSYAPLSKPGSRHDAKAHRQQQQKYSDQFPVEELEGYDDDPNITKVVDRRWYERNKHIFPASIWEDFDPEKDFGKEIPKDAHGNAFFFS